MREDVAAILFDEPLTVIDPHLKWLLRRKLKEVHSRFRHTLVYVTHDQNEALTFAEKVVVMYDGEVVQLGTPQELFERPAHRFVGYFIGSPGMNFLPCRSTAAACGSRAPSRAGVDWAAPQAGSQRRAELGIRPEFVALAPRRTTRPCRHDRAGRGSGQLQAGHARASGPHLLKAKLQRGCRVAGGRRISAFAPARTLLYADGRLIG